LAKISSQASSRRLRSKKGRTNSAHPASEPFTPAATSGLLLTSQALSAQLAPVGSNTRVPLTEGISEFATTDNSVDSSVMGVTTIQTEVPSPPASERARLLDVLWDSLAEPIVKAREAAWAAESERRIDAYDAGSLSARDANAVFADLRGRGESTLCFPRRTRT